MFRFLDRSEGATASVSAVTKFDAFPVSLDSAVFTINSSHQLSLASNERCITIDETAVEFIDLGRISERKSLQSTPSTQLKCPCVLSRSLFVALCPLSNKVNTVATSTGKSYVEIYLFQLVEPCGSL